MKHHGCMFLKTYILISLCYNLLYSGLKYNKSITMTTYLLCNKSTCAFAQWISFKIRQDYKNISERAQYRIFSERMQEVKENFPVSEEGFHNGARYFQNKPNKNRNRKAIWNEILKFYKNYSSWDSCSEPEQHQLVECVRCDTDQFIVSFKDKVFKAPG